ncbi:hypothetical protein FC093_12550 [Ilyomonas limi]|uniref:Beta-lactamase-inhibitor-like PepSY-like domain-containing protein n=1 Tax=Ilyomonas limi TaxID=2575867 RepID=A0A4U3L3B9_9BACT|nr:hypothetical protein [Ilyomonas limi]TKK68037.1 hypothetical protein FC093_12550 [Ilyomonas limi]
MKRNSIIRQAFVAMLALVVSVVSVSRAAAMPENVDAKILKHFAKTFATAENVTWKHTRDYSKASFTRNNQRMEVFYDAKDQLICTSTYITLNDMPCNALSTIQNKYDDYRCTTAIKCVGADGTIRYYTELENDNKKIILQSDADGYTEVFKTTKK